MAEENNSNAPVEQTQTPVAEESSKKTDQVSYDTHRKLLAEKKSMQERLLNAEQALQTFQTEAETKEQAKLEEQNQYKELYERLRTENEGLKTSINERDLQMQNALKIDGFNKALGDRKIDRKYRAFIDTKNIILDPQSGIVDQLSAQKEVERIVAEFPEIVSTSGARPLPNQAPQGVSSVKGTTQADRIKILADFMDHQRKG